MYAHVIFAIINASSVMYSGKKAQHDFPKMRGGVKGRLELFQKFIRFGRVILPLSSLRHHHHDQNFLFLTNITISLIFIDSYYQHRYCYCLFICATIVISEPKSHKIIIIVITFNAISLFCVKYLIRRGSKKLTPG